MPSNRIRLNGIKISVGLKEVVYRQSAADHTCTFTRENTKETNGDVDINGDKAASSSGQKADESGGYPVSAHLKL